MFSHLRILFCLFATTIISCRSCRYWVAPEHKHGGDVGLFMTGPVSTPAGSEVPFELIHRPSSKSIIPASICGDVCKPSETMIGYDEIRQSLGTRTNASLKYASCPTH
jgi:hypothetical protein